LASRRSGWKEQGYSADEQRLFLSMTPLTTPLKFAAEPVKDFDYVVSYAWGDDTPEGKEREACVDRLCAEAVHRGPPHPARQDRNGTSGSFHPK
jgi:hypothetical protein